jgi:TRAP-type transport system periplasmic protein
MNTLARLTNRLNRHVQGALAAIILIVLHAVPVSAYAQNTSENSTSPKQPLILKFNHTDTPSGSRHQAAELFSQRVAQLSKGRIKVMVFHSGQLGNDPQSIKLVSEGKLDFTVSATGSFAGLVTELNLTALPYLVGSYEEGWRFYDESPWLKEQFNKMPAKGLRHMATWEAGFRSFTTVTPLTSPADAKGKKMRVFPNEMIQWIVQAVGYEPVVIPVTDVYAAIAQGRVDGQENPIDTIRALRFYEVAPNIALTQHVYSPIPMVVSEQRWAQLSKADQAILTTAAQEASKLSRKQVKEQDERSLQQMQAVGAKITRPDITAFRTAMRPVYDKARAKFGANVDAILKDASLASTVAQR